jgi:hypothetical protein
MSCSILAVAIGSSADAGPRLLEVVLHFIPETDLAEAPLYYLVQILPLLHPG